MALLGVLLVLFFVAAVAALLSVEKAEPRPLRETLLIAGAIWAGWLVLGTELLSLPGLLRRAPVLLWWGLPTAALVGIAARDRRWLERLRECWARRSRPDWQTAAFSSVVAVILLVAAVVAAATPPNNWDSQTYHLPRQVRWMQQSSVEHYASPDIRQIAMPPMAEYAGLHFMVVTGNDHWANFIQWFALAMTGLAASLLARELGARARGQALAALLVVTNPMAVMQAVNTKNDLVLALWACAMAYFVLRVWTAHRCSPGPAALIGLTLGLLVLTKGTGLIFALPISAAGAGVILAAQRWRGLLTGAGVAVIALAVNAGHFSRNVQEFGLPTGPTGAGGGFALANETRAPAAIVSNVVRNASLHAGTPWDDVNSAMRSGIAQFHRAIGIDVEDTRTTYLDLPFQVIRRPHAEDVAPAPVHLALAVVIVPALLVAQRRNRLLLIAALVPYCAFLLFCIVLKWQPWHARLHLPIACLFAPVAATALCGVWRSALAVATAALAVAAAAPSILWNQQKPLLGGEPGIFTASWDENMFRVRRNLLDSFRQTVEVCRALDPQTLAIVRVGNQWEYPFQRALLRSMEDPPTFVSLRAHHTARTQYTLTPPDVIIHTGAQALWIGAAGARYTAVAFTAHFTIYMPQAEAAARGLQAEIPPFVGWNRAAALGGIEGPLPQHDLPEVRWGLGPATTLRFTSDGEPTTLIAEGRRHREFAQSIVVRLNGDEVARHDFGQPFEFQEIRVALAPKPGDNELTIEYSAWNTSTPRTTAVLYRRLQVLPDHLLEQTDADAGGGG